MQDESFLLDDDDAFFAELPLDEIVEMEVEQTRRSTEKENHDPIVICLDDDEGEGDQDKDKSTNNKTCGKFRFSKPTKSESRSTTSSSSSNKTGNNNSTVIRQHPRSNFNPLVSPIAACSSASSTPVSSQKTNSFLKRSSTTSNAVPVPSPAFVFVPPAPPPPRPNVLASFPPRAVKKTAEDRRRDDEWKTFLKWAGDQKHFDSPWFQSIPVTGTSFSQYKSIISASQDVVHLVRIGKLILSFLKESAETVDVLREAAIPHKTVHEAYANSQFDGLTFLELVLTRLLSNFTSDSSPTSWSQEVGAEEFYQSVFDEYSKGGLKMTKSRIPEILVQLYPKGFEEILRLAVESGKLELAVAPCVRNMENFLKTLNFLSNHDKAKNRGFEEDQDFIEQPRPKAEMNLANKFMESLRAMLGELDFILMMPVIVQPLFRFEFSLFKTNPAVLKHKMILEELLDLLNEIFYNCCDENDEESESLVRLLISCLPITSQFLKTEEAINKIKYKSCPYLYIALRKNSFKLFQ